MRDSAFGPVAASPDFWSRPDVGQALASRDMGELFRLLNRAGISQMRIGTATGNAQGRISDIIHGKYQVKTVDSFIRIADGLAMPDDARMALGLAPVRPAGIPGQHLPATASAAGQHPVPLAAEAQYPVTAGQAVTTVASLWTADDSQAQGLVTAPLDPAAWNAAALAWLVGPPDSALPEHEQGRAVGRADVDRVRTAAQLFAQFDNRFGGAHSRRSLIHYLRYEVTGLLDGRYNESPGRDLFGAVAEATLLAAWMSYDSGLHGLAQRYFIQALRLAESAADRRLACSILSAMSHQATFLSHLPEAANLARAAQTGLGAAATPTLMAQFQAMEARALAPAGDTRGCHLALAAAERSFQAADPGRDPEFIGYFNEAELAAELGHCFRDLGDSRKAAGHAARAGEQSDGEYPRSDFFAAMVLADACADQDDPEQACQAALAALSNGRALSSARCVAYVREFRQRLDRFGELPAIRDFRDQAAQFALWTKAA